MYVGNEAYGTGRIGAKAALFDGNSRIKVDAFSNFDWGSAVTISLWFKRTSADGYQSIISNGYYDTGSWEIRMGREGGGTMLGGGFITADHGTAWDHVGDFYSDHDTLQGRVPPAALNTWNHVAMTYDGEVVHFYVNGVQQGGIMNDSGDLVTAAGALRIGGIDLPDGEKISVSHCVS